MKFVKEEPIKITPEKEETCYHCVNRDGSILGATNPNATSDYAVSWGLLDGNHFFVCSKHLISALKDTARSSDMELVISEKWEEILKCS